MEYLIKGITLDDTKEALKKYLTIVEYKSENAHDNAVRVENYDEKCKTERLLETLEKLTSN